MKCLHEFTSLADVPAAYARASKSNMLGCVFYWGANGLQMALSAEALRSALWNDNIHTVHPNDCVVGSISSNGVLLFVLRFVSYEPDTNDNTF
jgi:hypothetical protein